MEIDKPANSDSQRFKMGNRIMKIADRLIRGPQSHRSDGCGSDVDTAQSINGDGWCDLSPDYVHVVSWDSNGQHTPGIQITGRKGVFKSYDGGSDPTTVHTIDVIQLKFDNADDRALFVIRLLMDALRYPDVFDSVVEAADREFSRLDGEKKAIW